MTTTPETITTDDKPHLTLARLAQQAGYAYRFAKAGQLAEALEHLDAIERLVASYRTELGGKDTLAAWLYQRFAVIHGCPAWDTLTDDDRSYWEHQAAAVRRAVARGGFKEEGPAE
jgi:hypothetical protein